MQASFVFSHILNFFDVLLLTTFVLACVLAFPLLLKRDRKTHDLLLALFIFTQGFYAFYSVMLHSETIGPHTKALFYPFEKLPFLVILGTQGLLLWWYTKAMMGFSVNYKSKITYIMLGLTVFTVVFNMLVSYDSHVQKFIFMACLASLGAGSVALGFSALSQLRKYELQLPFAYSSIEKHSLTWLRAVAIGFLSVWLLTVVAVVADVFGERSVAHGFYLIRHIPPLLLIAAMVLSSQAHAVTSTPDLSPTGENENINDDAAAYVVSQKLTLQLDDLMNRVKVYQDPELRLEGLADSMDISPRTLSTILNKHYQKSFYEFVNQFRVEDAAAQLGREDNANKSVQRVFEDAGFNSKTTFNTLFKKHTGQTPSEYRKAVRQMNVHTAQI